MSFTLDPLILIQTFGYIGLFAIIFAESGLFFGFFLPGDSLLFTAGFLASQGLLNIYLLLGLLFAAAVFGDTVGYMFGRTVGKKIEQWPDSRFFKKRYLDQAAVFYHHYGRKAIVLARFMPIVRTFVPIFAGVAHMRYKTFAMFNVIGGGLWILILTLLGYLLGRSVPGVDQYLTPIILVIIIVSLAPGLFEILRQHNKTVK